mmetsp:Transcript_41222/g.90509  ORF Transcript_41222/g.90509 Transcript_41222/m.90509 type:complete len:204 (+) Transcript_41222:519-1130(+)
MARQASSVAARAPPSRSSGRSFRGRPRPRRPSRHHRMTKYGPARRRQPCQERPPGQARAWTNRLRRPQPRSPQAFRLDECPSRSALRSRPRVLVCAAHPHEQRCHSPRPAPEASPQQRRPLSPSPPALSPSPPAPALAWRSRHVRPLAPSCGWRGGDSRYEMRSRTHSQWGWEAPLRGSSASATPALSLRCGCALPPSPSRSP